MSEFWPAANFVLLAAIITLLYRRRLVDGNIRTPHVVERLVGALVILGLAIALALTAH